ncbi:MAG: TIGR04283 family arsenosugar biosynthesis glycosyltransferase [Runella sp.]
MRISVIIPTLNEKDNICELVSQLRSFGRKAIAEIIVSDGGSSDATLKLAQKAGAVGVLSPLRGRAPQMNYGARFATGEILYFVHADTRVPRSFVEDIGQALSEGYEAGCYRFRFDSDKPMLKINSYFTRFDNLTVRGGDQTFFIKKNNFFELGGYDERYVIMEEYDFLRRFRKQFPDKFKLIPKDVIVSARKYSTNSWLRVQVANLVAMLMFRCNVTPIKIAQTYKKLLRPY